MNRLEQLQILWDHPNTENIIVGYSPDSDRTMFKVGYDIDGLHGLLECGFKLKTFKTLKETEPHRVDLYQVCGKYSFTVKIPTQPIGKWIIGYRDFKLPGALIDAPNIEPIHFECPVDGAILNAKARAIIEERCKEKGFPCNHCQWATKHGLAGSISDFRYRNRSGEWIASSFTEDYRYAWFIQPDGKVPDWTSAQHYKENS